MLKNKRRYLLFLFVLGFALISSCTAMSPNHKPTKKRDLNTSEWKTHILGRMQIDLPPNAVITKQEYSINGGGIRWRKDLDLVSLNKEINEKIKYYKSVKPDPEDPPNMFIGKIDLHNNGIGLHHWLESRYSGYSGDLSVINCYFVTKNPTRIFTYGSLVSSSRFEAGTKRLIELSKIFISREEDEIPSEPGFCFPGGFALDQEELRGEEVIIHATLPDYPGVNLVYIFEAAGFQKEDSSDMKVVRFLSWLYPGKVLRLGRRSMPDRPRKGREMCLRTKNENTRGKEYDFALSFDSEAPLNQPDIYFTMTTEGIRKPGSYEGPQVFFNDSEALKLWDALIKTIRPNPGSV